MRKKSPMMLFDQMQRIENEARRMYMYKPYTALLLAGRATKTLLRYAQNFRNQGISIDNNRNTLFDREVYAGY